MTFRDALVTHGFGGLRRGPSDFSARFYTLPLRSMTRMRASGAG